MMPVSRAAVAAVLAVTAVAIAPGVAVAQRGVGTSDEDLYFFKERRTARAADVRRFYQQFGATAEEAGKLAAGLFIGNEITPSSDHPRAGAASERAGVEGGTGWVRSLVLVALLGLLLSVALAFVAPSAAKAARLDADFVGVTAEDAFVGSDEYQAQALDRQSRVGIKTVRQVFRWQELEPRRGVYDFTWTDRYVIAAAQRGIRVMPVLFGEPAWATSRPEGNTSRATFPPKANADFGEFAAAVAGRYSPKGTLWRAHPELQPFAVTSYQLWNEPNIPLYWGDRVDPPAFARFITVVQRAIRTVHVDAKVITGGVPFSKLGLSPRRFLASYLRAGGSKVPVAIGVHPYAPTIAKVIGLTRQIRKTMDAHGAKARGMWITEIGWAVGGPKTPGRTVTAKRQAALIAALYPAFMKRSGKLRLHGVIYFAWRDSLPYAGRSDFWGYRTGLLTQAGAEKPAVAALTKSIAASPLGPASLLPTPTPTPAATPAGLELTR